MDQFWSIFDQFCLIFDIIGQKVFEIWLGLPERQELFPGLVRGDRISSTIEYAIKQINARLFGAKINPEKMQ